MREAKDQRTVDDLLGEATSHQRGETVQPSWYPERAPRREPARPAARPQARPPARESLNEWEPDDRFSAPSTLDEMQDEPRQRSQALPSTKPAPVQRPVPQQNFENADWGPDVSVPSPNMMPQTSQARLINDSTGLVSGNGPNEDVMDFMSQMATDDDPPQHRQAQPRRRAVPRVDEAAPDLTEVPYQEYQQPVDLPDSEIMEAMARASEDDDPLLGLPARRQRRVDPVTGTAQDITVDELLQKPPRKELTVESVTNVIIANVPQIAEQRARWLADKIIQAHESEA